MKKLYGYSGSEKLAAAKMKMSGSEKNKQAETHATFPP